MAEEEIKNNFIIKEGVTIFQSDLPESIDLITRDGDDKYLIATRRFEVGEVVFKNRAEIIPKGNLASNNYMLEVDGKYYLLNSDHHFIHRNEYAEMLGFDSFMDHSCSPNTCQVYIDKEDYIVYAAKTILPGEKVTCDYMSLENKAMGISNNGSAFFKCNCGESNCYGVLVC